MYFSVNKIVCDPPMCLAPVPATPFPQNFGAFWLVGFFVFKNWGNLIYGCIFFTLMCLFGRWVSVIFVRFALFSCAAHTFACFFRLKYNQSCIALFFCRYWSFFDVLLLRLVAIICYYCFLHYLCDELICLPHDVFDLFVLGFLLVMRCR